MKIDRQTAPRGQDQAWHRVRRSALTAMLISADWSTFRFAETAEGAVIAGVQPVSRFRNPMAEENVRKRRLFVSELL
jgi:hypothetical protein